jgi:hypothetical protein
MGWFQNALSKLGLGKNKSTGTTTAGRSNKTKKTKARANNMTVVKNTTTATKKKGATTTTKKQSSSTTQDKIGPAKIPETFRGADPSRWKFTEQSFSGSFAYDTIGKQEKVKGMSLVKATKHFKANPQKYVALLYQVRGG